MKEMRTEQQLITKNHPKYKLIDEMCYKSKNLYNAANYELRNYFFDTGEYIKYQDFNYYMKTKQEYKDCMSQPANCVMRLLDKNWKSFFVAIKDWSKNLNKYLGKPKPPKYLNKNGRYIWMIPNNSCYIEGNELKFRIRKLQDYKWYTKNLGRLIQVRFIPKGTCYMMEIVYEIEVKEVDYEHNKRFIAIDLGVNNFVTITNNIGEKPIIINGKGIKSINQFYNKRLAKEKSRLMKINNVHYSHKLENITFKRHRIIKNFMHNASSYIIKYCEYYNIVNIVIGKNEKWKHRCNTGNINNQKFIQIPYELFLNQLKYKCKNSNIKLHTIEESYTSGTSFIDDELPIKENYNKKRRIKRGLFKSNDGRLINSDVNGSYQILRKVFPEFQYGIGVYLTPALVNVTRMG